MKETAENKKRRHMLRNMLILGILYYVLRHAMAKKWSACEEPVKEKQKEPEDFRLRYLEE